MTRSDTDARPSADRQRAKTGLATSEVEHERRQQRLEERAPARDLLAEQEVEPVADVRDRDRGHEDGQQRRVAAVAAGRLAVAPGPVAGERVEQRRDAERVEREHVDEEAAEEAGDGADDRPAQQRDREQREQEHVGDAAGDVERREQRHLQQGRDEDDRGDDRALAEAHGSSGDGRRGTSTTHRVEGGEVDVGLDQHLLPEIGAEPADEGDASDRDPLRVERRERAGAPAGGDDLVADVDDLALRDTVERERVAGLAVHDDAGRPRPQVDGGDGALLVGEQADARGAAGHLRDRADEAVRRHDRRVDA